MRALLISLLLLPGIITAQDFAPLGSIWHYANIEDFFDTRIGYVTLESIGDTVIQGFEARVLEETEYRTSGDTIHKRFEFLRISGDTVWRYADDDEFYLLYNFSASVGDTWTTKAYHLLNGEDVEVEIRVDSITTTMINGQNLKTMYYDTGESDLSYLGARVTEVIGGESFMFPFNYAWQDGDIRIGLRCYNDANFGHFMRDGVTQCNELITDLEDVNADDQIRVYPNPSSGQITIELKDNSAVAEFLHVYSSEGKLVERIALDRNESTYHLSLSNSGLYFLQVIGNGQSATRKLIVN